MNRCQRCGQGTSWTNDESKLFGGVVTHLCVDCKTDWHEHFTNNLDEQIGEFQKAKNMFNATSMTKKPKRKTVNALVKMERKLERNAFKLGKQFVAQRITRMKLKTQDEATARLKEAAEELLTTSREEEEANN